MSYRTFIVAIGLWCFATAAWACPFCNAMKPTLTQQRESAQAAFIGEALDKPSGEHAGSQSFKVHRALKGLEHNTAGLIRLVPDVPIKKGSLALLVGTVSAEKSATTDNGQQTTDIRNLHWTATPLDEAAVAYVVSAPDLRQSGAKRLAFFSRFLEHRNSLIADDAYQEFAHATYDQTAEAAAGLPQSQLRQWFADPQVPPQRKGLYALILGLAKDKADREVNQKLLRAQIVANESDFRAGFDGILAAYLLLGDGSALDEIESRYLNDPKAADGDVRSALKALRFYHDFGHGIPPARIATAEERVLARPEFAAEAITDLARWQDWRIVEHVAALYERKEYSDPFVRRAIVGYLKVCPEPAAATALDRLRQRDPAGVGDAEKELSALSGR